jgi:hypothetical protein
LSSRRGDGVEETNWQQRTDMFPMDMAEEYEKFPMVTADQLRSRRERPRRVKMFTRDFIEGFDPLQNSGIKLIRPQILCTILHMGISPNKQLSSRPASHSNSTSSKMSQSSTNS